MVCGSNVMSICIYTTRVYQYSSEDAFSELQQEYLSFSNKSKYICLLGDFNARMATDTDFVDLIKNRHVDDYIADFVDNFTNVLIEVQD
jgi:parvulin-like peptidyl-prolyl isomerase